MQSRSAPLVLRVWQSSLLQQEVDTVGVTSQNGEHQRRPGDGRQGEGEIGFQAVGVKQPGRLVLTSQMNLLSVFVCHVGEVTVLPVVDHHVQTLRVAVSS